jgi:heat shock protein HslJ
MRVAVLSLSLIGLIAGCAGKESPAPKAPEKGQVAVPLADPLAPLVGTQWVLVDISGAAANAAKTTLKFGAASKVSGSGGCNDYNGGVRLQSGTVMFGPIQTTRMACAPPIMQQETRYFDVLVGARGVELDGASLYFLDITNSRTAHFSKATATP